MSEVKHTPLPWSWESVDDSLAILAGVGDDGTQDLMKSVLSVTRCKSCQVKPMNLCMMPTVEDAKFIVTACNYHYQLVDALERLLDAKLYADGEGVWGISGTDMEGSEESVVAARELIAKFKGCKQ